VERERLCEAYYHLGQVALARGDREEARRLFRLAAQQGSADTFEHHWARAELTRLVNYRGAARRARWSTRMRVGHTFHFGPRQVPRWYLLLLGVGFLVTGLVLFSLAASGFFGAEQVSEYRVCLMLAVAFLTVGAGTLFVILRARWRRARLLRIGLRTEATVLAVEPSWLAINDVTQLKVRYRYRDAKGREHEASSGPTAPEEVAGWKAGDVGVVYCDPERPTDALWTGERPFGGNQGQKPER
jgi:hypothetical protein